VAGLCFRIFKCDLKLELLSNLARIVAVLLGVYLVLKLGDLAIAGEVGLVFSSGWLSLLFLAEMAIGVIAPLVLFSIRRIREKNSGLILGAALVLLGLALNRTGVALIAQRAPTGAHYFPHWMEITISVAAVAAGILLFVLAVRFLPILPKEVGGKQSAMMPQWSRRAVVFVGGALSLVTIAVVLLLQPATRAQAFKKPVEATASLIQSPSRASCLPCHQDPQALASAGAEEDQLTKLVVEPQPPETPHGRLDCVTCHHGNGAAEDVEAAHTSLIRNTTEGGAAICVACHSDLPDQFPKDRLRTPHDEVTHGEVSGVSCSDCHGGVGHGFDPVSGDTICPMSVCLDCHQDLQLDPELSDCSACHIEPHDPVATMDCGDCHQSTETWIELSAATHQLDLTGGHAEVSCLECHDQTVEAGALGCAGCHQPGEEPHYGPDCATCHTPTSFQQALLPDHPVALKGKHKNATCAGCHAEGQPTPDLTCSNCHEPAENHLPGECSICHTPEGWSNSIAFVVDLAPQITHELGGREDCLLCHDPTSEMQPAPCNHTDYTTEQCILCHKIRH
jgi:hypothetical protein